MERKMEFEELTPAEMQIMRVVWANPEPISVPELTRQLKEEYGKDYARTTIVTFLTYMKSKGYVYTERNGKLAYVYTAKTEKEFLQEEARHTVNRWFNGSTAGFLAALYDSGSMSEEDIRKAREYLDEMG